MRRGEIAHSVSRGAFYLAIEKVAALLSGTAYFALLLRWVGPTNYGTMILALSFAGLATIVTGNFETYLERFAAEYQARNSLATLRRAHLLALTLKLALGVVAALPDDRAGAVPRAPVQYAVARAADSAADADGGARRARHHRARDALRTPAVPRGQLFWPWRFTS